MSVEDFDADIDELAEDHASVARVLLELLLRYVRGLLTPQDAEDGIDDATETLRSAVREWIGRVIPLIYADGAGQARDRLGVVGTPPGEPEDISDAHDAALDLLMDDLSQEMARLTDNLSADAKRSLREIGRRQLSEMMASGRSALPQAREMEDEMRERGVGFVDRGGRRWKPNEYARMVLRTQSSIISNEANLNAAAEMGAGLVRVRDGGPGDVDEPCRVANGQVWTRAYAAAHKLEHPNCRRSFAPLPRGFSGKVDRG